MGNWDWDSVNEDRLKEVMNYAQQRHLKTMAEVPKSDALKPTSSLGARYDIHQNPVTGGSCKTVGGE